MAIDASGRPTLQTYQSPAIVVEDQCFCPDVDFAKYIKIQIKLRSPAARRKHEMQTLRDDSFSILPFGLVIMALHASAVSQH